MNDPATRGELDLVVRMVEQLRVDADARAREATRENRDHRAHVEGLLRRHTDQEMSALDDLREGLHALQEEFRSWRDQAARRTLRGIGAAATQYLMPLAAVAIAAAAFFTR